MRVNKYTVSPLHPGTAQQEGGLDAQPCLWEGHRGEVTPSQAEPRFKCESSSPTSHGLPSVSTASPEDPYSFWSDLLSPDILSTQPLG